MSDTVGNPEGRFSRATAKMDCVQTDGSLFAYQKSKRATMRENWSSGFPTRSDTKRPVQSQKVRSLKSGVYIEEELYYPCSENKDADQLCSYCTAYLRHCFRMGRNSVFP